MRKFVKTFAMVVLLTLSVPALAEQSLPAPATDTRFLTLGTQNC